MNGVWGNLGVASAALITGYFIDHGGWRVAFIGTGICSIVLGDIYTGHQWTPIRQAHGEASAKTGVTSLKPESRVLLIRIPAIVFIPAAVSSLIFRGTTFSLRQGL